ncbi:MAG: preprotein translocase subunit YajC [Acidobacteriota bacterium]
MFFLALFGKTEPQAWTSALWFVVVFFAAFYFLIILPRKRQDKKHTDLVQSLQVRDKIVTIGGMYGEIKKINEKTLIIKISENSEAEILKNAVAYKQGED